MNPSVCDSRGAVTNKLIGQCRGIDQLIVGVKLRSECVIRVCIQVNVTMILSWEE